ncbi:hypothetical protein ACFQ5D_08375 [Paenibacillus farraposensis]|uniref:Uncharacterized protein n=3 Tax=Paenibacillus farraposensis TaxID=2807095 RepID=A0ABW4D9J3_9BACL|nr:hypothetical protein [Paenibacillus farraposensis]MCC3378820.1 hypothetical protein [Paenibacillus farraposensis]
MEYFIISQDKSLEDHLITFEGLKAANSTLEVTTDQAEAIKDLTVVFVNGDEDHVCPDFIERPVLLVSDTLKKVISMYDEHVIFKCAVLTNIKMESQSTYWLMLVDRLDCLSDQTVFDKAGRIQHIVIDLEKARGHAVFRIKGIDETMLVINLEITESILRRELFGMKIEKVETYSGRLTL